MDDNDDIDIEGLLHEDNLSDLEFDDSFEQTKTKYTSPEKVISLYIFPCTVYKRNTVYEILLSTDDNCTSVFPICYSTL